MQVTGHVCNCEFCEINKATVDPVSRLREECAKKDIRIRYPDLISERDAEALLGYATDSLRRSETRNAIGFKLIGNRRFYCLQKISYFLMR